MANHNVLFDNLKIGPFGKLSLVDPRGVPPGTGGGGPVEPPNPIVGNRMYGLTGIPASGFGPFTGTVQQITPSNATSLISTARAHGLKILGHLAWGEHEYWGNPFSLSAYIAQKQKLVSIPAVYSAILQAIEDDILYDYVFDEPTRTDRYGRVVTRTELQAMVDDSNEKFPGIRTYIRVAPSNWSGGHMTGLTGLWAQYKANRGDVTDFRDTEVETAQDLNHQLLLGMNVQHFNSGNTAAENGPANWITPAQFEECGGVLADADSATVDGMMCWDDQTTWIEQSGMMAVVTAVGEQFASNDP